jgi:hypothetical protein
MYLVFTNSEAYSYYSTRICSISWIVKFLPLQEAFVQQEDPREWAIKDGVWCLLAFLFLGF